MYARQVLTVPLRQKHIHVARTASLRPSLIRSFATHRDHVPSPLLTNVLDQKVRQANREDSVGPFQWGMVQPTIDHGEKVAKWKELSTKGKSAFASRFEAGIMFIACSSTVMRTTERTTNLTVILLGAGLSALLIYSLTTELFSKNSSTVLYNQACERIKASPRVRLEVAPSCDVYQLKYIDPDR
jgi:import inner membrane translocase subunit TIM21